MPEDKFKRRLRETKRRIITTLTAQGYKVSTFDSGPFDLCAGKGRQERRIRICFAYTTADDINAVRLAPLPRHSHREIWQISENGRHIVVCKVSGSDELL